MEVSGQSDAPTALFPGRRPGTHCIGGWVGPRSCMDVYGNSPPPGFDPQTVQPVACAIPAAVGTDGKSSQNKTRLTSICPMPWFFPSRKYWSARLLTLMYFWDGPFFDVLIKLDMTSVWLSKPCSFAFNAFSWALVSLKYMRVASHLSRSCGVIPPTSLPAESTFIYFTHSTDLSGPPISFAWAKRHTLNRPPSKAV